MLLIECNMAFLRLTGYHRVGFCQMFFFMASHTETTWLPGSQSSTCVPIVQKCAK